jgi:hypothetical protein
MEPPRRPNQDVPRQKGSATQRAAVRETNLVDDPTLLGVVAFIYAFFNFFAHFNAPECTC